MENHEVSPGHLAAFFSLEELAGMIVSGFELAKRNQPDRAHRFADAIQSLFAEYAKGLSESDARKLAALVEQQVPEFENPFN